MQTSNIILLDKMGGKGQLSGVSAISCFLPSLNFQTECVTFRRPVLSRQPLSLSLLNE